MDGKRGTRLQERGAWSQFLLFRPDFAIPVSGRRFGGMRRSFAFPFNLFAPGPGLETSSGAEPSRSGNVEELARRRLT